MYTYESPNITYNEQSQSFFAGIYGWMSGALAITAITAYTIASRADFIQYLATHPLILIALFVAQIGLVIILNSMLYTLSLLTAVMLFSLYAALMGVTFSSIFVIYTTASITTTFLISAGMFAATGAYGYFTKKDLTSIGSISIMLLFGLIIGGVVNFFMQSKMMELLISGAGVIIFTLLTAYDMQKLKVLSQKLHADHETINKVALIGALILYLDFINLFLFMLRLMGNRRES